MIMNGTKNPLIIIQKIPGMYQESIIKFKEIREKYQTVLVTYLEVTFTETS